MRHIPIIITLAALIAGLFATPAVQAAEAKPVDVFIGDSSAVQGAYSDGTTATQRWTRLFADADGADEVNVAVGGTGFVVGGANTFAKQADQAIKRTEGRNVRRVFVVGIGNDMSAQSRGDITTDQIGRALTATMPKIAAAWPGAQKLYVPEASPMTANMRAAYQRMEPYMGQIYSGVKLLSFTSLERWDTLVDGNGTSKDGTHLNRKGNNLMAHAMQRWVNTLDGPKNEGTIPAWGDGTVTLDAATFPDEGFRDWLKAAYDKDGNGKVAVKDVTYIGPHLDDGARYLPVDIEDPTGIDLLTALTEVSIIGKGPYNKPTSGRLDLSGAIGLERLNIDAQTTDAAPLTIVLPPNAPDLTEVTVDSINLVALESAGTYPKLSTLSLVRGDMTTVDVTGMPALTALSVDGPKVASPDLTHNPRLTNIALSALSSADADKLALDRKPNLKRLRLSAPDLTPIRAQLERLSNAEYMSLWGDLDSFDVKSLTSLKTLDMATDLRSLDLRGSTVTKFMGMGLVAVAADDTTTVELDGQPHIDDASLDLSTLPGIDPAKFDMTAGTIRDGRMYPPVDGSQAGYTYHTGSPQSDTTMWVDFNAYWVHYDLGYDGRALDPMPVKAKTAAVRPADPTRPGYTFAGWTQAGKPYDFSTPVSRVTWYLTASWTKKPVPAVHTVSFDSGGGLKVESQTVEQGKPVAKPQDPTRDGYEFKEWTLDGKAYDFTTPVTRDITLTAAWSKKASPKPTLESFTVTFDAGENASKVEPVKVEQGKPVSKPQDPTWDGHRFDGWTLDGKAYDFSAPVTQDLTLTATWTPIAIDDAKPVTHTVAFDTGSNRFARTVAHGGRVARPADPTRPGYTFTGWRLNGKPYDFSTPVVADITLTATWAQREAATPAPEPALPATGAGIIPLTLLVIGMLATGGTILYLAHRKHQ